MAKRKKYKKTGTKDFLILTILCAVMCVWSLRDGWFPSSKMLKKHPPELVLSFATDGVVLKVDVKEGESVKSGLVLAKLATGSTEKKLKEAEVAYAEVRDSGDKKLADEKRKALLDIQKQLLAAELKVAERYQIEIDDNGKPQVVGAFNDDKDPGYKSGYNPEHAIVKEVLVKQNRRVAAGEPAVVLNTKDHFYPFNKVLSVISGIGIVLFGILHILASRD